MKEQIEQVQKYFKDKIINGEFEIVKFEEQ